MSEEKKEKKSSTKDFVKVAKGLGAFGLGAALTLRNTICSKHFY